MYKNPIWEGSLGGILIFSKYYYLNITTFLRGERGVKDLRSLAFRILKVRLYFWEF